MNDGAKASNRALQDAIDGATPSVADSAEDAEDEATHAIAEAAAAAIDDTIQEAAESAAIADGEPKATVTVATEEQENGDVDATRTKISIEMPAGAANPDFPDSPEQAIRDAKAIVTEAKDLQNQGAGSPPSKRSGKKRKAEDLEVENSEEEVVTELVKDDDKPTVNGEGPSADGDKHVQFGERTEEPPAKRTRVMVPADEFRKQKMQKRALMGLTATVAVG